MDHQLKTGENIDNTCEKDYQSLSNKSKDEHPYDRHSRNPSYNSYLVPVTSQNEFPASSSQNNNASKVKISDDGMPRTNPSPNSYLIIEEANILNKRNTAELTKHRAASASYLNQAPKPPQNYPSRNSSTSSYILPVFDPTPGNPYVKHPSYYAGPSRTGSANSYGESSLPPAPSPYNEIDLKAGVDTKDVSVMVHGKDDPIYNSIYDYDDVDTDGHLNEKHRKNQALPPIPADDPDYHTLYNTQKSTLSTTSIKESPRVSRGQIICYTLIGVALVVILTVVGIIAYFFFTGTLGPSTEPPSATNAPNIGIKTTDIDKGLEISTQTVSTNAVFSSTQISATENGALLSSTETTTATIDTTASASDSFPSTKTISTLSTSTTQSTTTTTTMQSTSVTTANGGSVTSNNDSNCQESMYSRELTKFSPYPDPRNILLWYHDIVLKDHPFYVNRYEAYFIKVLVISDTSVPVKTVNKVGLINMTTNEPEFGLVVNIGDLYGTRVACPVNQIVCAEFKKGGQFSNGHNTYWYDHPLVEVSVEDDQGSYSLAVSTALMSNEKWAGRYNVSNDHKTFTFQMERTAIFDFENGVYRSELQFTAEEARKVGRRNCLHGIIPGVEGDPPNKNNWAIKFTAL